VIESSATWISRVSLIVIELHDKFKPGCVNSFYSATSEMHTLLEGEDSSFGAEEFSSYVIINDEIFWCCNRRPCFDYHPGI
jgi:hypothetical protein